MSQPWKSWLDWRLGHLSRYQQVWYKSAGQTGQAQDLLEILTAIITVSGLLIATSYPSVFVQLPEPRGYAVTALVDVFRFCNAVAFLLALLATVVAFGVLQFLATWRTKKHDQFLQPWAAEMCVRVPYQTAWWLFLMALVFEAVGLACAVLYLSPVGFGFATLATVGAVLAGVTVFTCIQYKASPSSSCEAADIYEI